MSEITMTDRLALKTPKASFLHVLQDEFSLSLREAREVVSAAQEYLGLDQPSAQVRAGQVRLVVASLRAPFGPPLTETERVTITLTVDAGPADAAVLAQEGRLGVRQGRILRLSETSLPLSILDVSRPYVSPTGIAPERLNPPRTTSRSDLTFGDLTFV